MNKCVLVTGGLGYIGSHTCVELIADGYEVVIIDNLSNSDLTVLDNIEKITGIRPVFYQYDLLHKEQIEKVFKKHEIGSVIHFAAFKSVEESMHNPLKYYTNNLISHLNILNLMRAYSVKKLVYSSSCTVYGIPEKLPVTEDARIKNSASIYGTTKIMSEKMLQDTTLSSPFFQTIILRYFNPVGAHSSGLLMDNPKGTPTNLFPYIIQVYLGKREKLKIFGNDYNTPDGTAIRDYIHVIDLARAHIKSIRLLSNLKEENYLNIFNIGTNKGISVLEVVKMFEKTKKEPLNYTFEARRAGDIEKIWSNSTKAEKELNWVAQFDLKEMVSSSLKTQFE